MVRILSLLFLLLGISSSQALAHIAYDNGCFSQQVTFHNGNVTSYEYTAGGEKLAVTYQAAVPNISVALGQSFTHDSATLLCQDDVRYYGDFIYENGQLAKYRFDGGYVTFANGQPTFHYYTDDHLGNHRTVVSHEGTVEQVTHYYPFGAVYTGVGQNNALQPYKYNGKELDRMHGLNLYDYGYRQYDPLLGRWNSFDSRAEKKPWQSPWVYGRNSPIRYIDPDGNDEWDIVMGYLVGTATNLIPLSGDTRDLYTPTDSRDYNTALQTTDNAFIAMGNSMTDAGNGGVALGLSVAAAGGAVVAGSGGTAAVTGVPAVIAGTSLTGVSAIAGATGTLMTMNATNNKSGGYNRGKSSDASKNERHGDGGRALSKANKQIRELNEQFQSASSKKEKLRIKQTISNIRRIAEKKRHGEEHSNANKR